jgi:hypothetical protein
MLCCIEYKGSAKCTVQSAKLRKKILSSTLHSALCTLHQLLFIYFGGNSGKNGRAFAFFRFDDERAAADFGALVHPD